MNWICFEKLNGDILYLRIKDIYKIVMNKKTKNIYVHSRDIIYECKPYPHERLIYNLEEEK